MNPETTLLTEDPQLDVLTDRLQSKLDNPEHSSNFDLHAGVNEVLAGVGLSTDRQRRQAQFFWR